MKKLLFILIAIILIGCEKQGIEQAPEYDLIGTVWEANHSWSKLERVGRDGTIRERATWTDKYGTVHYHENQWSSYMDNDSMVNVDYIKILRLTFNDSKTIGIDEELHFESFFGGSIIPASGTYVYSFDNKTSTGEWWTPIPGGRFNVYNFVIIPEKSQLIAPNQIMSDNNKLTFTKK